MSDDGPVRLPFQFGKPRDVPFVVKPWAESALRAECAPAPSLQHPTDATGSPVE